MFAKYFATYAATLFVFLVIDGLWLGLLARGFYVHHLGNLLRPSPNLGAAGLFYSLYVLGVLIFVIFPALNHGTPMTAALYGALFGLIAYATYDLTNLATLQGWPLVVTAVDMVWGAALTASVAILGFFAARMIFA
ncbi:MAG: hypothetical protein CMM26_06475 [Rhodospirillaceae bacterium]|nr:hypothetical protein [Rhodospirillaceae bacterium]